MNAIKTKYIGATNYRGSRVKASDCDGNCITLNWDDEYNAEEMHYLAARALCNKMGWTGDLLGGGLKDCEVWVFASTVKNAGVKKCVQ